MISPTELLDVDDHLANCEACRQRLGADVQMQVVVSAFDDSLRSGVDALDSAHLSYKEIAALVDGEIPEIERNALERHLEICESCANEKSDLSAFRADLLASLEKAPGQGAKPAWWEKMGALMQTNRLTLRPALTAALALLLIATSVGLFFVWKAARRSQSTQQAALPGSEASPESSDSARQSSVASTVPPSPAVTTDEDMVVVLNDGGGRVTVDANGNVHGLAPLPATSSEAVKRALSTGRVEAPDFSQLIGVKGKLLGTTGDDPEFSLLSPVGIITRSTKPALRWRALNGATSYTVAILDTGYNVVMTSPPLTTTSWAPTPGLARGRVYLWQVIAVKDGKETISPAAPAPEARFKVLDKATADDLTRVERIGASHLVRGTLYARAGLLDEAEKELRELVAANPNSPTARQLLQSVRAIRRR